MNDPLYRSRSDRMLAGVAGGVAEHFDLDPSLVRVLWAILVIVSGGIFLLIYIVMAIVVPEEPIGSGGWTRASGWSGSSGWSSSWPSSASPTAGPPGPAGPGPTQAPPSPATPGDPAAAAAPSADPDGSASGPTPPGPVGPGFAAPGAGGWTAGSATGPDRSARDERRAARDARHAARQAARQARRDDRTDQPGRGGVVAGLVLVAIGLYFLVSTLLPELDIDRYWPAGLIVLGVLLVGLSIRRTPGGNGP
ncbi:MAG: PspC domain-containing protein [Candidatus Limnocylindrales bacterium]